MILGKFKIFQYRHPGVYGSGVDKKLIEPAVGKRPGSGITARFVILFRHFVPKNNFDVFSLFDDFDGVRHFALTD